MNEFRDADEYYGVVDYQAAQATVPPRARQASYLCLLVSIASMSAFEEFSCAFSAPLFESRRELKSVISMFLIISNQCSLTCCLDGTVDCAIWSKELPSSVSSVTASATLRSMFRIMQLVQFSWKLTTIRDKARRRKRKG